MKTMKSFIFGWALFVVFCLLVTPIAVVLRLVGRDKLRLRYRSAKTYWVKRKNEEFTPETFKNH